MPTRNLICICVASIVSYACYNVSIKKQSYASQFAEVVDLVQRESLLERSDEELFDNAITGMMNGLDEHSVYFSGRAKEEFDNDLKQQFGGVGMYVDINPATDRLTVMSPIPDSPVQRAGIQTGDIIDEIDGESTVGMTRKDAIDKMRGKIDTKVSVNFLRGEEVIKTSLKRQMIPIPSVRGDRRKPDTNWNFHLEGQKRIGYIQILQFGEQTAEEVKEVVTELDKSTDALIIDLRNNTGGLMRAAIEICNLFLDGKYKIVETRRRGNVLENEFYSNKEFAYGKSKPVVILVNRFSASASEIVSACLQDHGRATIVGEQSWGKGTVQNVIPIDKGRGAIKLTIASYWRPSGENIDRRVVEARGGEIWGVRPDPGQSVEMDEEQLFNNMRMRNQRASLLAPDAKPGQQDVKMPKLTDDPVMKKALEFLNKLLTSAPAA